MNSLLPIPRSRTFRGWFRYLFLPCVLAAGLTAADATKPKVRKPADDANVPEAKVAKREEKLAAREGAEANREADSRQLERLRERLGVTDDAEWTLISGRIAKVEELRRALAQEQGAARPNAANPVKVRKNAKPAGSEFDALRAAVNDGYPEAEIKARLAKAHEARQNAEQELAQAQTDLRAVLSVRQEAIVVMAGLLPP
jgi:hypothetical protein